MKKSIILIAIISIFGLFLTSCGSMFEGPQGPAGEDGKDGTNGNANVSSFVFNNLNYQLLPGYTTVKRVELSVPAITQNVIDKGTVQVFVSVDGTTWWALPFDRTDYSILYLLEVGKIYINIYKETSQNWDANFPAAKVVVIGGN